MIYFSVFLIQSQITPLKHRRVQFGCISLKQTFVISQKGIVATAQPTTLFSVSKV